MKYLYLTISLFIFSALAADLPEETLGVSNMKFAVQWRDSLERYDDLREKRTRTLKENIPLEIQKVKSNLLSYLTLPENLSIPKKIHYIWIGNFIPENYWKAIMDMYFIAKPKGYKIYLWTDNFQNIRKLKTDENYFKPNNFFSFFEKRSKHFVIKNISDLKKIPQLKHYFPAGFLEVLWHFIEIEQIGLKNLGAASDLLRYLILVVYGGIYSDTDIHVLAKTLYSQGNKLKNNLIFPSAKFGFQTMFDNNPLLVSSQKHPILLITLLRAMGKYLEFENKHAYDCGERKLCSTGKFAPYLSDLDRKRRPYAVSQKESAKKILFTGILSGPVGLRAVVEDVLTLICQKFKSYSPLEVRKELCVFPRSERIWDHKIVKQLENFQQAIKNKSVTSNENSLYKDVLNVIAYEYNVRVHDPLKHEVIKKILQEKHSEVELFIKGLGFKAYKQSNNFFIITLGNSLYLRYVCDLNWCRNDKIKYVTFSGYS